MIWYRYLCALRCVAFHIFPFSIPFCWTLFVFLLALLAFVPLAYHSHVWMTAFVLA
jgi:hypothetical protein